MSESPAACEFKKIINRSQADGREGLPDRASIRVRRFEIFQKHFEKFLKFIIDPSHFHRFIGKHLNLHRGCESMHVARFMLELK